MSYQSTPESWVRGPFRIFVAPLHVVPTRNIGDIINLRDNDKRYDVLLPWADFGLTYTFETDWVQDYSKPNGRLSRYLRARITQPDLARLNAITGHASRLALIKQSETDELVMQLFPVATLHPFNPADANRNADSLVLPVRFEVNVTEEDIHSTL